MRLLPPLLCRRLLAQVCLVREEVQNVARTAAFGRGDSWTPTSDKTAQLRGGVPRRAVAFLQVPLESRLQRLISVPVPGACGSVRLRVRIAMQRWLGRAAAGFSLPCALTTAQRTALESRSIRANYQDASSLTAVELGVVMTAGGDQGAQPGGAAGVPAQGVHLRLGGRRPRAGRQRQVSCALCDVARGSKSTWPRLAAA